ncbi:MAG: histone deacetylase family protein [Maritimibacter sp.]|nr:histone deacetylase family protein [Maritimibacter sp.]
MDTIYSEKHRLRDAQTELSGGELVYPFERPSRMDYILARLGERDLGPIIEPDDFGLDPILRIHTPDYVTFLQTAWDEWQAAGFTGEAIITSWSAPRMSTKCPNNIEGKIGYYGLSAETAISPGTWEAAYTGAQVALTAAERLRAGARGVFALCRPPGHHATGDMFGGYCFLNNAAIATQYLRDKGAARVAILDVDFHHGNGTQDIFYARDDVLFVSLHGDPMETFPYYLGHAEETGTGEGAGHTLNFPMPPGTPYAVWRQALAEGLARIAEFAPDALVVSLGVDAFEKDPISFFKLTSDDFRSMGAEIATAGLPTLFVMEGGYAIDEIGVNAVNTLEGFEGR